MMLEALDAYLHARREPARRVAASADAPRRRATVITRKIAAGRPQP